LVRNSTISGNQAAGGGNLGGGLAFNLRGPGTGTIQNSTITANSAAARGGGLVAYGALLLQSTIVSGNSAATAGTDIDSKSSVQAQTSAIGAAGGFTLTDLGGNLPFGADLKLGPLANNGGPTFTHALLPGSAALNKGANPGALTTDQRGLPRD